MINELEPKDNSIELPSGNHLLEGEELEQKAMSPARIAELESLLAQRDEELVRGNVRLAELEQVIVNQASEIASLKQAKAELDERLITASQSLAKATASYKAMVIQANPEVLVELIQGETIESINESLSKAKTLISKVRQGLKSEISLAKVPMGAPERTAPDLSTLSPREKIEYAIGGKR